MRYVPFQTGSGTESSPERHCFDAKGSLGTKPPVAWRSGEKPSETITKSHSTDG